MVNPIRWVLLLFSIGTALADIDRIIKCGSEDLCEGKDREHFPSRFKPTKEHMDRCYCDRACADYGDCCVDKATFPYDRNTLWTCVPVSMYQSVYAVSNCIENSVWKKICEKEFYPPKYEHLVDLPIFSNITEKYYANIFCAFCDPLLGQYLTNGLQIFHILEDPKVTIQCTSNITLEMLQSKGNYNTGTLSWTVGDGSCAILPEEEEVDSGRQCVRSVASCPSGTDPALAAKCGAYSFLLSTQMKIYKNPHCAICNGLRTHDIMCEYRAPSSAFISLSMLMGFDWDIYVCDLEESIYLKDNLNGNCSAVSCNSENVCHTKKCKNEPCSYVYELRHLINGYLTYICLSVSIVCLLIHVFKSIYISPPKNLPAKVLNSLAWSLLVAQTFFLWGMYSHVPLLGISSQACYFIAIIIQYFLLASFFWMNVISIDIWCTFSDAFKLTSKSYTSYALYAWGGAGACTVSSVTADVSILISDQFRPHYGGASTCWFGTWNGLALFFCFPVLTILTANTVFFFRTICLARKQHFLGDGMNISGRKEYSILLMYVKLSSIMGITWSLCLLMKSVVSQNHFDYPFTVLNGLQGAFIFVMFDLKTESVYRYIKPLLYWVLKKNVRKLSVEH